MYQCQLQILAICRLCLCLPWYLQYLPKCSYGVYQVSTYITIAMVIVVRMSAYTLNSISMVTVSMVSIMYLLIIMVSTHLLIGLQLWWVQLGWLYSYYVSNSVARVSAYASTISTMYLLMCICLQGYSYSRGSQGGYVSTLWLGCLQCLRL